MEPTLLVLNAGSSSIKFQSFATDEGELRRLFRGQIEGIGANPRLTAKDSEGGSLVERSFSGAEIADVPAAMEILSGWLREHLSGRLPMAIGHRVVHGGPDFDRPVLIDDAVLDGLERFVALAPLHQPNNLAPIRAIRARMPDMPQVACFDTAFHRTQDELVDRYAIPEWLRDEGVRRYGFHGLSYEYIAEALADVGAGAGAGPGRRGPSGQRGIALRHAGRAQRRQHHGLHRAWTACRWEPGRARSIPGSSSISSRKNT